MRVQPISDSLATVEDNFFLDPPPVRGSVASIRCSYDEANTTDQRFVAIYALPSDYTTSPDANSDRYAAQLANFRQALFDASQYMDGEADLSPSTANPPPKVRESVQRIKVLCEPGTVEPKVNKVILSKTVAQVNAGSVPLLAPSSSPFNSIKYDLRSKTNGAGQTFNKANEKYIVFYDARSTDSSTGLVQYGQGNQCSSETASASNSCNTQSNGLTIDAAYAVDFADSFKNEPNWHTFLHEMSHTIGAVHAGAAHDNGFGHCTDDEDVMCYDEAGAPVATPVCQPAATIPPSPGISEGQRLGRYDCGQDDYFNPAPAAGSYLATKWNIAAGYNKFVYHGTTEVVSRTATSGTANQASYSPSISENGRYVAFESDATNLAGGNAGVRDIFRRDRWTGSPTAQLQATTRKSGHLVVKSQWLSPAEAKTRTRPRELSAASRTTPSILWDRSDSSKSRPSAARNRTRRSSCTPTRTSSSPWPTSSPRTGGSGSGTHDFCDGSSRQWAEDGSPSWYRERRPTTCASPSRAASMSTLTASPAGSIAEVHRAPSSDTHRFGVAWS